MSSNAPALNSPGVPHLEALSEPRCPTCDQPLAHQQLEHVRKRLAAEKRKQDRLIEDRLTAARQAEHEKAAAQIADLKEAHELEITSIQQLAKTEASAAMEQQLIAVRAERKVAQDELAAFREAEEERVNERITEVREALEEDKEATLNKERAAAFKERQELETKVTELQRKLQRKTSAELGEGAEIDLFDALKAEFPGDEIKRVKKGQEGADIVHTVIENSRRCGEILYDSKNRNAWRNDYVEQLRRDQIASGAEHAVLSTAKFPAGAQQIHLQNGVIVANPARVTVLANLLRKSIVYAESLKLSTQAKDEKREKLYQLISSTAFCDRFERVEELTRELLELDVKEEKAHSRTWQRRGDLLKSVQKAIGELESDIDRIIGKE